MSDGKLADYLDGYAQAKADVIDRCVIEKRATLGDEAIERCIQAIKALDARHALARIRRWHHSKRGSTYTEVGRATLQASSGPVSEGAILVVYAAEDGKLWARPKAEFEDGRFTEVLGE